MQDDATPTPQGEQRLASAIGHQPATPAQAESGPKQPHQDWLGLGDSAENSPRTPAPVTPHDPFRLAHTAPPRPIPAPIFTAYQPITDRAHKRQRTRSPPIRRKRPLDDAFPHTTANVPAPPRNPRNATPGPSNRSVQQDNAAPSASNTPTVRIAQNVGPAPANRTSLPTIYELGKGDTLTLPLGGTAPGAPPAPDYIPELADLAALQNLAPGASEDYVNSVFRELFASNAEGRLPAIPPMPEEMRKALAQLASASAAPPAPTRELVPLLRNPATAESGLRARPEALTAQAQAANPCGSLARMEMERRAQALAHANLVAPKPIQHIAHFALDAPPAPSRPPAAPRLVPPLVEQQENHEHMDVDAPRQDWALIGAMTSGKQTRDPTPDFDGTNPVASLEDENDLHIPPVAYSTRAGEALSLPSMAPESKDKSRAEQLAQRGVPILLAPEGGFPTKHLMGPGDLLRGITGTKRTGWEQLQDDEKPLLHFFVEVYKQGPRRDKIYLRQLRDVIVRQLGLLFGLKEADIILASPDPLEEGETPPSDHPTAWVLHLVPVWAAILMLQQVVWPHKDATLFLHPVYGGVPSFLAGWQGFRNPNRERIREAIIRALTAERPLKATANALNGGKSPVPDACVEKARRMLSNISLNLFMIKDGADAGEIVASVYCEPPTLDPAAWLEWRQILRSVKINSIADSPAIARGPARCSGCHGGDHFDNECPFRAIPGWYGTLVLPNACGATQNAAATIPAQPDYGRWPPFDPQAPHSQHQPYPQPHYPQHQQAPPPYGQQKQLAPSQHPAPAYTEQQRSYGGTQGEYMHAQTHVHSQPPPYPYGTQAGPSGGGAPSGVGRLVPATFGPPPRGGGRRGGSAAPRTQPPPRPRNKQNLPAQPPHGPYGG